MQILIMCTVWQNIALMWAVYVDAGNTGEFMTEMRYIVKSKSDWMKRRRIITVIIIIILIITIGFYLLDKYVGNGFDLHQ